MEKTWKYGDRREDGFIYHGKQRSGQLRFLSPEADAKKKAGKKLRESLKPKNPRPPAKEKTKRIYDPIKAKAYRIKYGQDPEAKKGNRKNSQPKTKTQIAEEKKEFRIKTNKWVKEKLKTDPLFKLKFIARNRIGNMIRKIKAEKKAKSIEIIGCSWKELKKHIESQFTEGMTWENHGLHGWHIDHIIPLSCATEIKGLTKLCHYSNLRPLWAKENRKKKDNLILI